MRTQTAKGLVITETGGGGGGTEWERTASQLIPLYKDTGVKEVFKTLLKTALIRRL